MHNEFIRLNRTTEILANVNPESDINTNNNATSTDNSNSNNAMNNNFNNLNNRMTVFESNVTSEILSMNRVQHQILNTQSEILTFIRNMRASGNAAIPSSTAPPEAQAAPQAPPPKRRRVQVTLPVTQVAGSSSTGSSISKEFTFRSGTHYTTQLFVHTLFIDFFHYELFTLNPTEKLERNNMLKVQKMITYMLHFRKETEIIGDKPSSNASDLVVWQQNLSNIAYALEQRVKAFLLREDVFVYLNCKANFHMYIWKTHDRLAKVPMGLFPSCPISIIMSECADIENKKHEYYPTSLQRIHRKYSA